MGDLLRSDSAKQLANQHQVKLRTKALHVHRWGIGLLGACEALCHLRGTIEPMVASGTVEPPVAADLDPVNMFGYAERPCGRIFRRPQLGPRGSISLTLTLLSPREPRSSSTRELSREMCLAPSRAPWSWGTRENHLRDFHSPPSEHKGVCDECCVVGGQVFVRPWAFDGWLCALDAALASFAASRSNAAHGKEE